MTTDNVSIVIVNYNTRQLLMNCLHSIVTNLNGLSIEILVADNSSTDGSVTAVRSSFPEVYIVENESNLGYAKANNQLIPQAKGDILVLLNPDTEIMTGAIAALITSFDNNPLLGVVGPQILNPDRSVQPSCGSFASIWTEFLFQSFIFKLIPSPFPLGKTIHRLQRNQYQTFHEVDWVTGACLAIRKDVVEQVGYLNEAFFMYGEDMEWCWRVRQAGYKVYYQPTAKVIHYSKQSSMHDYRAWIKHYTNGQIRFIDEIHSAIYKSIYGLLICIGSMLRIILWTCIEMVKSDQREEARQRIAGYKDAVILGWHTVSRKSI